MCTPGLMESSIGLLSVPPWQGLDLGNDPQQAVSCWLFHSAALHERLDRKERVADSLL